MDDIQKIKKETLDKLFYEIGKQQFDFEVCGLCKDKEGNTKPKGKWIAYSKVGFDVEKNKTEFNKINCRTILPIEIVLDIETREGIEEILEILDKNNFYYRCYDTGSRGYHLHLFFDNELSEEEKGEFIAVFNADMTKKSKRNVIALEEYPHWKTGNPKKLYKQKEGTNAGTSLNNFIENYIPKKYEEILKDKNLFNNLNKEFEKKIVGEEISRKTIFLSLCSVWLKGKENKLHTFISSISSSGKSYLCKKIILMFPVDNVIYRSKISAEVFTYWHEGEDDWTWDGKILYLEDISQNLLDSPTFKVMLSEGSYATVTRNQKSVDILIRGKPLILLTTASTNPNDEIINRFQILSLDESESQTENIIKKMVSQEIEEEYDEELRNSLKFLKEEEIFIPYASNICNYFLENKAMKNIKMRRDFPRLLDLIKCSTTLYQKQREKDDKGRLIATQQDYEISQECINYIEYNTFLGLTHSLKKAFDYCKDYYGKNGKFNAKQIQTKHSFVSDAMWYKYLEELSKRDLLEKSQKEEEGSFKKVTYYKVIDKKSICLPDYQILIEKY